MKRSIVPPRTPAGLRPVHAERPRTVAQCKTTAVPCPAPNPQRLAAPPVPRPATGRLPQAPAVRSARPVAQARAANPQRLHHPASIPPLRPAPVPRVPPPAVQRKAQPAKAYRVSTIQRAEMVVLAKPRLGVVEKDSDRALVEDLYKTSQRFREVWDDITRQYGAINVMETTDRTHFDRGTIYVNKDVASHARKAQIAFEVTNAYQNQRTFLIQRGFAASDQTAEEYATAIERVEFEGTLLHSEMMREGIESGKWHSSMDLFGNLADYAAAHGREAAFAQYLAGQKQSGHFNRYVEQAHDPRNVKITKVGGSLTDLIREGHF